jgi:transposase
MNLPIRIGMDTSKSVFQLHGVDENEAVVVRRQLSFGMQNLNAD